MNTLGRFDPDLEMFVEEKHELNVDYLRWMRWLAEQGRLEHEAYGPADEQLLRPLPSHTSPAYSGKAS
jgi:hypothetical protein